MLVKNKFETGNRNIGKLAVTESNRVTDMVDGEYYCLQHKKVKEFRIIKQNGPRIECYIEAKFYNSDYDYNSWLDTLDARIATEEEKNWLKSVEHKGDGQDKWFFEPVELPENKIIEGDNMELNEILEGLRDSVQDFEEKTESAIESVKEDFSTINDDVSQHEDRLDTLESKVEDLEYYDLGDMRDDIKHLISFRDDMPDVDYLDTRVYQVEADIEDLKSSMEDIPEDYSCEISDLQNETQENSNEISELKIEIAELKEQIAELAGQKVAANKGFWAKVFG